jgi:hypothetical protein
LIASGLRAPDQVDLQLISGRSNEAFVLKNATQEATANERTDKLACYNYASPRSFAVTMPFCSINPTAGIGSA